MIWNKTKEKPKEHGIYLLASKENVHNGLYYKLPLDWYLTIFEADTDERLKMMKQYVINERIDFWAQIDLNELERLKRLEDD